MQEKPVRIGRPPKAEEDRKGSILRIRLTGAQRAAIKRAARGNVSAWVRMVLLAAAEGASDEMAHSHKA